MKKQIWTITEILDGEALPWVRIFESMDEAKHAIAEALAPCEPPIGWDEFEESENGDETGWMRGQDEDASWILTRLA